MITGLARAGAAGRLVSRRRVLGTAAGGAVFAAGAIARPGSIEAMIRSRQAPHVRQAPEVSGHLRVLSWGDGTSDDPFNNAFREAFPNVELEHVGVPGGSWAEFADGAATRIAGGEQYDAVSVATEGQRVFAYRGLVEPYDDLIERDAEELEQYFADFDPRLVEWGRTLSSPDGQTYYLPGNFNTVGVWCNLEMFEAAGLPEPDGSWTWDEFKEAAGALSKEDETFGVEINQGQFPCVMPWLLTNGASVLNEDWSAPVINSAAAIESAEFMRSFVAEKMSPEPGGEFDASTMMAQNRLAMSFAGKWPQPGLQELGVLDKMKIVDSPQKTRKGSPIGWTSVGILKGTENREAAWQYARFLTAPQVAPFLQVETPARRSVSTSPEYIAENAKGIEVFYNAVDYATPIVGVEQASLIQADLEDTFSQILIGNLPAAEGLNDLNTRIQENLV